MKKTFKWGCGICFIFSFIALIVSFFITLIVSMVCNGTYESSPEVKNDSVAVANKVIDDPEPIQDVKSYGYCIATTKKGTKCRNKAKRGSCFCGKHC